MKIIIRLCLLIAIIPNNSYPAAEGDAPIYAVVSPWTIAIDESLKNGCFIYAEFTGGTFVRIGKDNRNNSLYVFLGDPHWQLIEYGEQYPIQISFGGKEAWEVIATGASFDPPGDQPIIGFILSSKFDIAAQFLYQFMKQQHMEIFHDADIIAWIDLKNSYRAGMKLMECQRFIDQEKQIGSF